MKKIRRTDRQSSPQEAMALLDSAEYGVLSTVDTDGQPYGVPLNYVYRNHSIYFHCAQSGQKIDNMDSNAKVSFCVVGKTKVLPDQFATDYESTVVFGVATEIAGAERYNALVWLLEKYCAAFVEEGKQYIALKDQVTKVYKIAITHISGKARREGA